MLCSRASSAAVCFSWTGCDKSSKLHLAETDADRSAGHRAMVSHPYHTPASRAAGFQAEERSEVVLDEYDASLNLMT